jgi:hypothetical protein
MLAERKSSFDGQAVRNVAAVVRFRAVGMVNYIN